ncbi:MAG: PDZ domain-containing protein [Phycisphaerales bacterium]|nr:PDZ domain-containing protein [Phycisphaerales bacterium]
MPDPFRFLHCTAMLALLLSSITAAAVLSAPPVRGDVEDQVPRLFSAERYEEAATLLSAYIDAHPNDADMLYNLACAFARLGRTDDAADTMLRAVESGFVAFDHMMSDPDLDAIRDHPTYTAILEAVRRVRDRNSDPTTALQHAIDQWKDRFGDQAYRYAIDEQRRLAFATALDAASSEAMRTMLIREADHCVATLFGGHLDVPVLIAIPTPDDADTLLQAADIGGMYVHASRRLIARNIGDSLRHEFVHAMHFAHMERIGQKHPLWIQEGIAALYETYSWADDGTIVFEPNDRRNIAKRRQRAGRLMAWDRLFDMTGVQFMRMAGRLYPEVRSIFEYLAAEGKLSTWYSTYVLHFDEDSTGRLAMEKVFDAPLRDVERAWQVWLAQSPAVDDEIRAGEASLGIRSSENASNDGVFVADVLMGGGARAAGVRRGDVIVALDDVEIRSLRDLTLALGGRSVGDEVALRIRRREAYQTITVRLTGLGSEIISHGS